MVSVQCLGLNAFQILKEFKILHFLSVLKILNSTLSQAFLSHRIQSYKMLSFPMNTSKKANTLKQYQI